MATLDKGGTATLEELEYGKGGQATFVVSTSCGLETKPAKNPTIFPVLTFSPRECKNGLR